MLLNAFNNMADVLSSFLCLKLEICFFARNDAVYISKSRSSNKLLTSVYIFSSNRSLICNNSNIYIKNRINSNIKPRYTYVLY